MSIQGLKSLRTVLLPCEEKRKCSIVRCCAEFLNIGNHSLKLGLHPTRFRVNELNVRRTGSRVIT